MKEMQIRITYTPPAITIVELTPERLIAESIPMGGGTGSEDPVITDPEEELVKGEGFTSADLWEDEW